MANPLVTFANMFSGGGAAPATPVTPATMFTPATPGNVPAGGPVVPATPGNPTVPATTPAKVEVPASPLAEFADLWKNDPNNKPVPAAPAFNVDSAAMAKTAATIDFRSGITPELATRMKAGGEDGMAAMMEAMNGMSQTVFAKAAEVSATLINEGVKKAEAAMAQKLPAMIKKHNLRDSLQENPVLSNTAAAPLVTFVTQQIQLKHPNATESQLRQMASNYFDGFAQMVNEQTEASKPKNKEAKTIASSDFSDW